MIIYPSIYLSIYMSIDTCSCSFNTWILLFFLFISTFHLVLLLLLCCLVDFLFIVGVFFFCVQNILPASLSIGIRDGKDDKKKPVNIKRQYVYRLLRKFTFAACILVMSLW